MNEPRVNGPFQAVRYQDVKESWMQEIKTAGWRPDERFDQGGVVQINGLNAMRQTAKGALPAKFLAQFVIVRGTNADERGHVVLTITPPIVGDEAFRTVSDCPVDGARICRVGNLYARDVEINNPNPA